MKKVLELNSSKLSNQNVEIVTFTADLFKYDALYYRTLPTSLEDGENFGKNERWYNFSFLEKRTQSVDVLAANAGSQNIRDNTAAYF